MSKESIFQSFDLSEHFTREISKYNPLTAEEVDILIQRVIIGKEVSRILATNVVESQEEKQKLENLVQEASEAREKLVLHNLKFIRKIAGKYKGWGVPVDDLMMGGIVGLLAGIDHYDPTKAINNGDPTKPTTFLTYVGQWVIRGIQKCVCTDGCLVDSSMDQIQLFFKIQEISNRLLQESGKEPSIEELAEQVGLSPKRVERLLSRFYPYLSLNEKLDDGSELCDFIEDEKHPSLDECLERDFLRFSLESIFLHRLSQKEAIALWLHYGLYDGVPRSHLEVGRLMALSHERVRQLEKSGLEKLRNQAKELFAFYNNISE